MLFDTGVGAPDSRMMEGLKSLNVKPEDIDCLLLTHFHGDHIGGMMKDGKVVFPKAEVYASKAEYDAWMKMPADKRAQVETTMNAYKDRLHLFAFGDTLPGNMLPMEAIGHTPGHTVYKAGKLLVIGESDRKPVYAKDEAGKYLAYLRIKDENILATPVHLRIWQQSKSPQGELMEYTEREQLLLDLLEQNDRLSLNRYCRLARLSRRAAEHLLAKLIRYDIVEPVFEGHKFHFKLK